MPVAFRAKPCVVAGDRREAVVEECVKKRYLCRARHIRSDTVDETCFVRLQSDFSRS